MKKTTSKKILLGSAMAGLVLAGPSLTASGHLFQTADLGLGYRLAQAEAENPQVGDRGSGQEKKEAEYKKVSDEDAKAEAAKRDAEKAAKEKAKGAENKCGEGSCG